MPVTIIGNQGPAKPRSLTSDVKFDYDYPPELGNLRPGESKSSLVISEVINRAFDSNRVMERRHPSWKEIDRTLTGYIPLSTAERLSKSIDSTKPIPIVFPVSYENLETLRTYLGAALLTNPMFMYEGIGAGVVSDVKASLMELVVGVQIRKGKAKTSLQIFFRDLLAYGLGAVHLPYVLEKGSRTRRTPKTRNVAGVELFESDAGELEKFTIFAGTKIEPIDVYKVLPDPDIPFYRANEGGYFGWVHRTSIEHLLEMELSDPEHFFNVRYIQHLSDATSRAVSHQTGREDKFGGGGIRQGTYNHPVDIIWMYIKVIPSVWGIGSSDYPERWLFGVAGDGIVIAAHKMALDHNRFPIATAAPDTDGHGLTPVSKMEVIYGLQTAADFYFNTRSLNVLKALNDMWVVDPQVINVASMKTTGPGKVIYLKRNQWGENKIDSAIRNYPVQDVTQGLSKDVDFVRSAARSSTGAVDQLLGIMQGKGRDRVSATEASALQQSALSRMEHLAQVVDEQAMYDMADQCAYNTRQFMDEELFVRLTGRHQQQLTDIYGGQPSVKITPDMIDTDWDILANDGTIPGSGNVTIWQQIFQAVSQQPELQQQFDIVRIFKYLARIAGAKNVEQFQKSVGAQNIQPTVAPDENVLAQADAGNVLPINEGGPLGLAA